MRAAFALLEEATQAGTGGGDGQPGGRSVKAQMKAADRSGYRWVIVVGEDELAQELLRRPRDMFRRGSSSPARPSGTI